MNERIKELADQCMVEVKNVPCNGIDGWTTLETVRQIDPEKFAEFIVLECRDIIYDNSPTDNLSFELYCAIKDHFGIE